MNAREVAREIAELAARLAADSFRGSDEAVAIAAEIVLVGHGADRGVSSPGANVWD